MSDEQKQEAFQEAFQAGLEAIRTKKYALGVRAFKFCIRLNPERPTAYYNIACCYSLQNMKKEAIAMLEEALKRGFGSFEHMTRDEDLVNIREEKAFKALVAKYKKKVIESAKSVEIDPKRKGHPALLVFLHGRGQSPENYRTVLEEVANEEGFGVLLPRGDVAAGSGFQWGQAAETVVLTQLKGYLEKYDPKRIVIGGFSTGAMQALEIGLRHADKFAGILDFSPIYDGAQMGSLIPAAGKKGLKVFMTIGKEDPFYEAAREARDSMAENSVPVILRRFSGGHRLPANTGPLAVEGMRWILAGEKPAAGKARPF